MSAYAHDMRTLVCVPITVHDDEAVIRDAQLAAVAGADLIELRMDEMFDGSDIEFAAKRIEAIIEASPLPVIVTCRASDEGGMYEGDENSRVAFYERIAASSSVKRSPGFIDFELSHYTKSQNIKQKINLAVDHSLQQRDVKTSLILSCHDFKGVPKDLFRKLASMRDQPAAAVLKVAFLARNLRDALEALHLPRASDRPMISLAMGEFGLISRVLAPKFGGFLTFAALRPAEVTAPGQPTIADLFGMYNFRAINSKTKVYGVIGWPVGHSKSPLLHNAGFQSVGFDGVYLPLPVAAFDDEEASYLSFKASVTEMMEDARLDFRGASVTLPHKVNLLRLAAECGWKLDDDAVQAGAANTIVRDGDIVRVLNSDVLAIRECVRDLPASRVLILGAGGVARAAIVALRKMNSSIVVSARDASRAAELAREFGIATVEWETVASCRADLVINCTPVGMAGGPAPDQSPVASSQFALFDAKTCIFDTVYTPRSTPLIAAAVSRGMPTITGDRMFLAQARAQFEAWTGVKPPCEGPWLELPV